MYSLARNSPKENSGASGGFLLKPLLLRLRLPNSKTNQPKFWQILSQKNSFAKTSSALKPHVAGVLASACEVITSLCFGNRYEFGTIQTLIRIIIINNKNLQTVSAVVVFNKRMLLLLRDNTSDIRDPGCWQLPGDGVEEDETSDFAIRRELREEIGIIPHKLYFLATPYPGIHVYHTPLTKEEAIKIRKGNEGTDLQFFSFDEILDIPLTQKLQHAFEKQKDIFMSLLK